MWHSTCLVHDPPWTYYHQCVKWLITADARLHSCGLKLASMAWIKKIIFFDAWSKAVIKCKEKKEYCYFENK